MHVNILHDTRSKTQRTERSLFSSFLISAAWQVWLVAVNDRRNSSPWALFSCQCFQRPLDYCNTEMSHQPRSRQSAHPAWSGVFIYLFFISSREVMLIFNNTLPHSRTEININSSECSFLWQNRSSGKAISTLAAEEHKCLTQWHLN